ncbi:MAG TPA: cyclic nucleotide-binding domain-containing protein [Spirochaetota bacterium]|nr:cyclic nucleotide-binding domain-containing protein [Spirochaetota bacterium]HQO04185.1 cyclic nucleotide-binding domain-containing protein [Spirochaetota bacterium]HQP50269.1 cyclic nucleotide-binding domain-containing protein [Spirochaetota bacterium]
MLLQKFLIALIPVPLFYLIYFRYFTFKPEYIKHFESFLYGITLALVIILVSPFIYAAIPFSDIFTDAFIKAAALEKIGAFMLIYIIHRYYPNFSIMESVVSAMMLGIGFSLVENIFYAMNYGQSIILIRLIVSVPLHLTTCGYIGYYLGLSKISDTTFYRAEYTLKALLIPIILHGTFDMILLSGGRGVYILIPMLLIMIMFLELMIANAHNILPLDILDAMKLRFEDWLTINRQPRYDRWIMRSMGTPNTEVVPFFRIHKSAFRWILVVLFFGAAVVLFQYRADITAYMRVSLSMGEKIVVFGIFPASISITLILVGAINPQFFEESIIRIPIISDVVVNFGDRMEETFVTYHISTVNCFLKTSEELGIGTEIDMTLELPHAVSPPLKAVVVWENFTNRRAPLGSTVRFKKPPWEFYPFLIRYYIFRFIRGIIFNLKFPGFEAFRRLFMRPITTMQNEKLFMAGSKIFREGDAGNQFYLIKTGKVIFYKNKSENEIIVMDTMEAGEIFGEMSIVGDHPRAATAVCVTDCVLAVSEKDNLDALIRNNPDFAISLIKKLADRVNMSEKILSENIKQLQMQKKDNVRFFHVAMMLTLVGLGYSPVDGNINLNINLKNIEEVLKQMDDETAAEIINLVMKKQQNLVGRESDVDEKILDAVQKMYEKYNIDISY